MVKERYILIILAIWLLYMGLLDCISLLMISSHITSAPTTIQLSSLGLSASFLISSLGAAYLARISVWKVTAQILPLWFSTTVLMGLLLLLFRLDYSNIFILISWPSGLILLILLGQHLSGQQKIKIAMTPATQNQYDSDGDIIVLDSTTLEPPNIDAFVATPEEITSPAFASLMEQLAIRKIPILTDTIYHEQITGRIDLDRLDAIDFIQLRPLRRYMLLKRFFDVIIALIGIVLALPLMLIVALMITIESRGGVIFTQQRIGEGGKEFTMYKFRSMRQDAEASGAKFATTNDSRITSFGRFLRKFRIDELPQLINVLNGSMSLIGPRPEQKVFVDELAKNVPFYSYRHTVRPGITGWAQVMQGYADDVSSNSIKLSYDLFYIKNQSLMMDFVIFFKTIKTILTGFGAR